MENENEQTFPVIAIKKDQSPSREHQDQDRLNALLHFAENAGATMAARISPAAIKVEDKLADYCQTPRCPHYGLSMSCPPHVEGPAKMRQFLDESRHAIVLRIEIDAESLHGEQRPEVLRLLQEITAAVEREAVRLGYPGAQAFAGGSCKISFCADEDDCRVLAGRGPCRHPDAARPSMSGYGINVGALMQAAGWSTNLFQPEDAAGHSPLAWVAGLVLLP